MIIPKNLLKICSIFSLQESALIDSHNDNGVPKIIHPVLIFKLPKILSNILYGDQKGAFSKSKTKAEALTMKSGSSPKGNNNLPKNTYIKNNKAQVKPNFDKIGERVLYFASTNFNIRCHVPFNHIPERSYPLFKARYILERLLSKHGHGVKRT